MTQHATGVNFRARTAKIGQHEDNGFQQEHMNIIRGTLRRDYARSRPEKKCRLCPQNYRAPAIHL